MTRTLLNGMTWKKTNMPEANWNRSVAAREAAQEILDEWQKMDQLDPAMPHMSLDDPVVAAALERVARTEEIWRELYHYLRTRSAQQGLPAW